MTTSHRLTLTQFLIEERRRFPHASGDFNSLILNVALACKSIARKVACGALAGDLPHFRGLGNRRGGIGCGPARREASQNLRGGVANHTNESLLARPGRFRANQKKVSLTAKFVQLCRFQTWSIMS